MNKLKIIALSLCILTRLALVKADTPDEPITFVEAIDKTIVALQDSITAEDAADVTKSQSRPTQASLNTATSKEKLQLLERQAQKLREDYFLKLTDLEKKFNTDKTALEEAFRGERNKLEEDYLGKLLSLHTQINQIKNT